MKNSKHQLSSSQQSTNTVEIFRITVIDRLKNNIQKIEGNFENLPLENGKFDLIINNLCLHSINDKHNHLKKLYDLLTKDGLFLCNFFGEKTLYELKTSLFQADEKIFNGINKVLDEIKLLNKKVFFMTNAPRRSKVIEKHIKEMKSYGKKKRS